MQAIVTGIVLIAVFAAVAAAGVLAVVRLFLASRAAGPGGKARLMAAPSRGKDRHG